jgi:hypothetical protein
MKAPFVRALGILVVTVVLGATLAYGQEPILMAKIDFSFGVPGKTLPPGEYTLTYNGSDETVLTIRGVPPDKQDAVLTYITRLSQQGTSNEPRLVFDKVGDKSYLSEVWFPGEDGFLVTATPGKHTHATVKAVMKK